MFDKEIKAGRPTTSTYF